MQSRRPCRTELLGTKSTSIAQAEDREQFKQLCESLGEPVLPSDIANSIEEGLEIAVPRVFLPLVLKGCVAWAKENGVELITAEHMQIINDKRAKEKKKSAK